VVVKEMGGDTSVEQVRLQWVKRGSGLMKPGAH
jgi:tRNASer (uridine44-2'-O)-methyltransferase